MSEATSKGMSTLQSVRQKARFVRNLVSQQSPPYLIYFVTKRCNLDCEMCFNWEDMRRQSTELELEEVRAIARNWGRILQLSISGGEPILRPDLPLIIEAFYQHASLSLCTVTTNGFYKDRTLNMVREILERCPLLELRVAISLDGLPEVHNHIRRHPLSFERAVETFHELRRFSEQNGRLALHVTTVVSRSNHETVDEIYDFVKKELETPYHTWLYTRGNPPDPDTKNFPLESYAHIMRRVDIEEPRGDFFASTPIRALMASVRETILRTAATDEMQLPCVAGRKIIVLTAEGDLKICELFEEKGLDPVIGNLREVDYEVQRLLKSERAQSMIRSIAETKCHCTWECATVANHVFNPAAYSRVARKMLRPGDTPPLVQIRSVS